MAAPRRLAWPALSVVSFCVSLLGCCWYGRVPLLGPVTSRLVPTAPYPCACVCPEGLNLSGADLPLDQGGASKTLETVPMAVLRERVALREQRGLSSLDHVSLSRYYLCPARKELLLPDERPGPERSCGERRFAEGGGGPVVALASFHGSGNTWVRHLLEQASGVFTGSIYCDQSLKRVFPGEQVVGGGVLAVKTHQCDSTELPLDVQKALGKKSYDKAIVLVRDPFDALISEANRRWNTRRTIDSHVGLADEAAFLSKSPPSLPPTVTPPPPPPCRQHEVGLVRGGQGCVVGAAAAHVAGAAAHACAAGELRGSGQQHPGTAGQDAALPGSQWL